MSAFNNQTRKAIHAVRRTVMRSRFVCSAYASFEAAKRAWSEQHPDATPSEYERAMIRIAREMGI